MSGPLLALALGNSLLWSLYLLLTRHVVSGAQLDAWAYTLVQLLTAGLALLWLGRRDEARTHFGRALGLARTTPERRLMERRLAALSSEPR